MRRISILGATGSIGQNTIDLVARAPESYDVVALTGGQNIGQLAADARRLGAEIAVTADAARLTDLRDALLGSNVEAAAGSAALIEAADRPADWVMSAIVGAAGLAPGLKALERGTTLAIANKESLVTAGPLLMASAAASGSDILPVDSEHSGVFQALLGEDRDSVERVIITASGGALRDWPIEKLREASLKDALAHPNWSMGKRITIDSASMFNKAMEVIETREYFDFSPSQIEVLIHPQSLIHAMVGHCDGGLLAHIGPSDMRHAIGYALNWPSRDELPVERLDFAKVSRLDFDAPDEARYPALRLARDVMERRGQMGAVFTAAKELALDGFIEGHIRFTDMAEVVARVLDEMEKRSGLIDAEITLDSLQETDHLTRQAGAGVMKQVMG